HALRLLFLFSSRRRHTTSYGDWSSDVCSSDLCVVAWIAWKSNSLDSAHRSTTSVLPCTNATPSRNPARGRHHPGLRLCSITRGRSEERRVGKECRAWREDRLFLIRKLARSVCC